MENSLYNDVISVITDEGKECIIKQDTGNMFSVVGAVLIADKNNWLYTRYKRKNIETQERYLKTVTFKSLNEKVQVVYKGINYNNIDGLYITDEETDIDYTKNLFEVQQSYSKKDDGTVKYVSYDVILSPNQTNISNSQNEDNLFDAIGLIGLPYKINQTEINNNIIDKNKCFLFSIVYFPTEKIKFLHNQHKKLVFNIETHYTVGDDLVLDKKDLYPENLELGLHQVNNGSTNTVLTDVNTIGGTTKLLIW